MRVALLVASWIPLAACDVVYQLHRDDCLEGTSNHDEDGDGIADACDLCPHITSDNKNADGDGLGDECDPDPSSAQCIARFEPFETMPPSSFFNFGSWAVDGDRLVHRDAIAVHELLVIEGQFETPSVELAGRFLSLETHQADQPIVMGVYSAIESLVGYEGIAIGAVTQIVEQPTSPAVLHTQRIVPGSPFQVEVEVVALLGETRLAQGTELSLRHVQQATALDASGIVDGYQTSNHIDIPSVRGAVGIRAYNAAFEVDYVLVTEPCRP